VSVPIPPLGNNSVQYVEVGVDDVREMRVQLVGSGAVAEIVTCGGL
jgi:hypothetical protein